MVYVRKALRVMKEASSRFVGVSGQRGLPLAAAEPCPALAGATWLIYRVFSAHFLPTRLATTPETDLLLCRPFRFCANNVSVVKFSASTANQTVINHQTAHNIEPTCAAQTPCTPLASSTWRFCPRRGSASEGNEGSVVGEVDVRRVQRCEAQGAGICNLLKKS